ncbi:MAG: tetratricopeptide repeat protein [Bacteroidia bacterium]|nr:tetratricopeptide repeat protein [Bacteroidia bacterium]
MEHGEYGAARVAFSEFLSTSLQQDLKRGDAEYYKAFCAVNLFQPDGEKLIENFIAQNDNHPRSTTAYFDLANFYYTEKNYVKASSYFAKTDLIALSAEQQNSGRFKWGYSLFNQRKLKDALDEFNFIKTQGGQYGPASSYYAGFIEYSQAEYDIALTDLQRAEQSPAYSSIVPYLVANLYYKQRNYDQLLSYVSAVKSIENLANQDEISLLSAEANFKKSDYQNALEGYQEYLEDRKGSIDKGVLFRAGYSAFSVGEDDAALDWLKQSALDNDSIGYYSSYFLGSLYLKMNQKTLAITAFENARNFKSDKRIVEESTFQAAKLSYDLLLPDKAITEFEKFVSDFPASVHATEVKELLSHAYLNANNYNKAIEYIESFPKRNQNLDRAYQKATLLKGIELFNMEDYPNAVHLFEKSLLFPIDQKYVAEASFWCGESYSIGKKYEQAAVHYLTIIGLTKFQDIEIITKTRYGLGYSYFNLYQYDRALISFREFVNKSTKANPNYVDGIIRLGDCYYVTKSYPDALSNYRRAIQLNSVDRDYAHLQTGNILAIQRKYVEAAGELEQVIKNYPQSRFIDEAMFKRSELDFEQGNYLASVSGYTKLINTGKSSRFLPYGYLRRAASYYNLKDYNKTSNDYIAIIDQFPAHPLTNDVLLPLQEALNLAGRAGEFDEYMSQFKTANPGAKGIEIVEFESAKTLYFNQDYPKAIASFGSYVVSYPDSPRLTEAEYYQAESFYRLKDIPKALEIYYRLKTDQTFLFASRVTARIAELEFKQGRFEKAIPEFHRLAKIAANKKEQYNAWSGLMESHYFLAQYDSAFFYAQEIIKNGNVNASAQNKASVFIGKSAMAKGDYDAAKDEFINTLNTAQDEYGAEAKYLLAEIFYLNKDHKQSNETLVDLKSSFSAYTYWVGKAFLLMADNYKAMGEIFQAKGTLKSLIENFPLQHIKDQAEGRLKKIEEAELKKQSELNIDTTNNQRN